MTLAEVKPRYRNLLWDPAKYTVFKSLRQSCVWTKCLAVKRRCGVHDQLKLGITFERPKDLVLELPSRKARGFV